MIIPKNFPVLIYSIIYTYIDIPQSHTMKYLTYSLNLLYQEVLTYWFAIEGWTFKWILKTRVCFICFLPFNTIYQSCKALPFKLNEQICQIKTSDFKPILFRQLNLGIFICIQEKVAVLSMVYVHYTYSQNPSS